MKRKFTKILGVGLALVLVLTLGLVTAVPVAANPEAQPVYLSPDGVSFTEDYAGTAEWSYAEAHSGKYSVKQFLPTGADADASGVVLAYNDSLASLPTVDVGETHEVVDVSNFYFYCNSQRSGEEKFPTLPYIVLDIDTTGDSVREYVLVSRGSRRTDEADPELDVWQMLSPNDHESGTPIGGWVCYPVTEVEAPTSSSYENLGYWQNEDVTFESTVLNVKLWFGDVGTRIQDEIAYVDDVTINGVTYDLERLGTPEAPIDVVDVTPVDLALDAGSTYDIHLLGFEPESVVYLDDIDDDILLPADSETGEESDYFANSNDSFFITLDANGDGTFTDKTPLYASNYGGLALDMDEDNYPGEGDIFLEVWPSNYEGVSVTANVASFTYDETKAFIVTVTKDGAPLSGAYVEIGIDYHADGEIDYYPEMDSRITGATGQAPFSITLDDGAGLIIPEVYMDIGGTLGEPEEPDGAEDIWNTACQIPINPIAVTVTAEPSQVFSDFESAITVTAEYDTTNLGGATVTLKGCGVEESGTTDEGGEWTSPTITPDETGTIAVTVSRQDGEDGVPEYLGTTSILVVEAEDLNVSVLPTKWDAGTTGGLTVDIVGSDACGPDGKNGESNNLNWAKVEVSLPVDQSLSTGNWDGSELDGISSTETSVTFLEVLPNDASSNITVTVTGELDDETPVDPVTIVIPVSGYVVTDIMPDADQAVGDISDISLTVTTVEDIPVNSAGVIIIAEQADGFQKDIEGDEELESFQAIFFAPWQGEIWYMTDPEGEPVAIDDFLVNNGYYEVTDIEFAQVGDVEVYVGAPTSPEEMETKASFPEAFTVLGVPVYSLTFEPITLTAGVDAAGVLEVTITDDSEPALDVATILIGGDSKDFTSVDNVYTITEALLYTEADTLTVMAKNVDETSYGTDTLAVELPAVSYVITDAADVERNVMLTDVTYTVSVTVIDALGEALASGNVWLGTYAEETFTPVDGPHIVTDGAGEFDITPAAVGTLVWKVGSGSEVANAALVLEPAIAVEAASLILAWDPEAPEVGEEITFTVTNNYGDPAGDIDVTVVTPGGDPINKVTTPEGVFKYTTTEDGDYYVSVGEQDPVTVPVVVTRLVSITASPLSVSFSVGETEQLIITATYEDESAADVTATADYESDAESVATVDAGLITAVAEGEAIITVSYTEGLITKTTDVLVTVPVLESIAASPPSVSLNVGGTRQLTITATYSDENEADVTATATYDSDAESVATVTDAGLITAVAIGEATITVSYTEDEIPVTAEVPVTVSELPEETIQLWVGANPIYYTGATTDLPGALTNISEITEVIWQRDISTAGEWWYYLAEWDTGQITQLENGRVYIIVVSEDCIWELSQ